MSAGWKAEAQVWVMLIMMVGWLNVPTPPQEIEVLELFAGTGRLCRLAKACAIPSQAHDLLYDKHERSSMDYNSPSGLMFLS